ncbi:MULTISPECIES: hypothetical protein [Enterobacteriaceae]|uniref:Uncharacterized protein n=1 Tax=Citrobacter telavivensis TaxID=2653932 RepID=A0A6L5EFT6_9ENTR|nr:MULTISPECIES: hypothetical protein [Enterobacteriaceae]HDR2614481.1 hypothetical protein [Enterobacter ludwigii]MDT7093036.1 hypothetical protein [Citrobacter freundii]MPQ54364.1 hypothetical protein [Citrobacter telavivensis]QFS69068.1 hypothetical protein GBC03_02065 [Citrobacter telavivensis]QMT08985.1 hypothetical protein H1R18_26375 [Enterobacter kobei]
MHFFNTIVDIPPAEDRRSGFEQHILQWGFSVLRDECGQYASEITRAAWLGFSLYATSLTDDALSLTPDEPVIPETDSPLADLSVLSPEQFFKGHRTEATANVTTTQTHTVDLTEEEQRDIIESRLLQRAFSDKNGHASKKEAMKQARLITDEYLKPSWVYKNNDQYYVSTHGFDLSRRPDVTITQSQVDALQKVKGMPETGQSRDLEPGVVARFGYNGRIFQQCGRYLDAVDVVEWIAVQQRPAIFISIPSDYSSERKMHIDRIRRELLDYHDIITAYRWVTTDTVVMAISHHAAGIHARDQVQNPWWLLRAFNRPNSLVFGRG